MNWTEVVTHPLGLAAFALALVLGMAGRMATRKRIWFLPTAITLAALVIAGGLFLAYKDIQFKEKNAATAAPPARLPLVNQETHGPNSPAVQEVSGNVNIIQNQGGKEK
jgi:hypothetical protein